MAIAVMPRGPDDRWERRAAALMIAAAVVVIGLFVYSMLSQYVF